VRIAYAGTPEFAVPALHALIGSRHSVVGVLTQPDRPKGRGRQLAASPVKQAAVQRGLPISQPLNLRHEADRATLRSWNPDVLVVVAYGLLLPEAVLGLPPFGCVNIHASLLPRWRGAAPIQRAILAGDEWTGVTIMRMDAGLDTGPILLQERLQIEPQDTAATLHDRLSVLGPPLLLRALDALESRSLTERPQPQEGVTYAAKIDKAEAIIDWSAAAADVVRKVRAFNPWPIAETRLDGEPLRVFAAAVVQAQDGTRPDVAPGTITGVTEDGIIVASGSGSVAVSQVQRPGRRCVSGRDLAHTRPLIHQRLG
jgi:methionyl-tRNA formyltransferase